jgi:hypothetical protein
MYIYNYPAFLTGRFVCLVLAIPLMLEPSPSLSAADPASADASRWTVFIAHDNCPDYTWGFTEEQTRWAFADIVKAHLDRMNQDQSKPAALQDRYTMAVTQEALCFVEKYPARKDELIGRIRQGRVLVSPFLCNSLWAFQDFEGALRTLYPARRLEREWKIPIDIAEHIEHPALPWGMAAILAGSGIRWLSVPFYNYDSPTFAQMKNPPLFEYQGPDGSTLNVILDPYSSNKASYAQGSALLRNPGMTVEWIRHYQSLGETYPLKILFASGTHSDISPDSGNQVGEFFNQLQRNQTNENRKADFLFATVRDFTREVDAAQKAKPFLPKLSGCFGHSWDLWPVSLAKYAADMRNAQRAYLSAETLLAIASCTDPKLAEQTQADRRRAEWCWAMLSDHAWNGTDIANKRHNAQLRKDWAANLDQSAQHLQETASQSLGHADDKNTWTIFNPLSFPQQPLLRIPIDSPNVGLRVGQEAIPSQVVIEDGRPYVYAVSPRISAYGLESIERADSSQPTPADVLSATPTTLQSPHYRLTLDPKTGGVSSLIYRPSNTELVDQTSKRHLVQSVYFDVKGDTLSDSNSTVVAVGPVLAQLKVTGKLAGMDVVNFITVYQDLDRIDFDLRIEKPVTSKEQRLCQFFPLLSKDAELRIDTPGAVVRPKPQPAGDLLPGADPRRFCVQDFLSISQPGKVTVTIVPVDAFALRLDLGEPAFECLGNDQNYKEVTQDQDGVTSFRFRYSLQAHEGGYELAKAVAFSRSVLQPPLVLPGRIDPTKLRLPKIAIDPAQAVATCLKPADDPAEQGLIMRLQDTGGQNQLVRIGTEGFQQCKQTDLLERDLSEYEIREGMVQLPMKANGYSSIRLIPK